MSEKDIQEALLAWGATNEIPDSNDPKWERFEDLSWRDRSNALGEAEKIELAELEGVIGRWWRYHDLFHSMHDLERQQLPEVHRKNLAVFAVVIERADARELDASRPAMMIYETTHEAAIGGLEALAHAVENYNGSPADDMVIGALLEKAEQQRKNARGLLPEL